MAVEIIFYSSIFFTAITTTVSVYNFFSAPRIRKTVGKSTSQPLISILIPARNEEKNIGDCISDIFRQTYHNYELIILDDESEDETAKIVNKKISDPAVSDKAKLVPGNPLPPNWIGKNWACHQLSLIAKGKLLLFVDADVRMSPHVIESCASYIDKYGIQLMTCFPTQIMRSFGERMVVPLMNFLLLTFLPLKKVYSSSKGSFIAANGQFLIVDREAYDTIGGHTVVADKVVEDMELARRIKKRGFRMMTFLGQNSVTCRMYSGFKEAFTGFTKNYYPGFNTSALNFLLILVFVFITFFLPFLMIFMNSAFLWIVSIILLGRSATSLASKQNFLLNCMAHPIQIILMLAVGINSVTKTKKKKIEWKGRSI